MNRRFRTILGPAYPHVVRVRTSPLVRDLAATLGLPGYRSRRRADPSVLAVDIDSRMGMGATIAKALLFHALAEDEGTNPFITSSNPLYADLPGRDFLDTYFQRPAPSRAPTPLNGRSYGWALRKVAPQHISLHRAQRLFHQYFQPTELSRQTVDTALAGRPAFDLSIHYRGTDKFLESGPVEVRTMLEAIDRAVSDLPMEANVFLATDDPDFALVVRERYPECRFTSFDLGAVERGVPRHFSAMLPAEKALEAVANVLLLASAPLCIRTSSYLSALSKIANPALSTRTINTTLSGSTGFPEAEVLRAEIGVEPR